MKKFKEFYKNHSKRKKIIAKAEAPSARNTSNYINQPLYGAEGSVLVPTNNVNQ